MPKPAIRPALEEMRRAVSNFFQKRHYHALVARAVLDLLFILGTLAIIFGIAQIYSPAAWITTGLYLSVFAVILGRGMR